MPIVRELVEHLVDEGLLGRDALRIAGISPEAEGRHWFVAAAAPYNDPWTWFGNALHYTWAEGEGPLVWKICAKLTAAQLTAFTIREWARLPHWSQQRRDLLVIRLKPYGGDLYADR